MNLVMLLKEAKYCSNCLDKGLDKNNYVFIVDTGAIEG